MDNLCILNGKIKFVRGWEVEFYLYFFLKKHQFSRQSHLMEITIYWSSCLWSNNRQRKAKFIITWLLEVLIHVSFLWNNVNLLTTQVFIEKIYIIYSCSKNWHKWRQLMEPLTSFPRFLLSTFSELASYIISQQN